MNRAPDLKGNRCKNQRKVRNKRHINCARLEINFVCLNASSAATEDRGTCRLIGRIRAIGRQVNKLQRSYPLTIEFKFKIFSCPSFRTSNDFTFSSYSQIKFFGQIVSILSWLSTKPSLVTSGLLPATLSHSVAHCQW